jgi:beta-glucanase (GH16 family)
MVWTVLLIASSLLAPGDLPKPNELDPKDELPTPPAGQEWTLAFHDEFDGDTLDATKWDVPEYQRRDGWWSKDAISLDGEGHLKMSVLEKDGKFLDGCIRTRGKFEHAFGYYVTRVKLQTQVGHWSAFWLYNDCEGNVGNEGRDGTEIDIFEKPGLDSNVQHTLHWDGYGADHHSSGKVSQNPGVMEGWHTFSLWWTPEEYRYYVDGKETWRTSAGGVCQVPLYVKLSDEVGGWAGDIHKATLPDEWFSDYIRVYDLTPVAEK